MFLRQIPDPHLSQYAYIIGCQRTGEAVVVDPERDIDRYREVAAQEGLKITAVAETHIHADFVSGAREFANADPSLKIYVSAEGGPDWQSEWANGLPNVNRLHDGDVFKVGNIELKAVHTPGHTPEHMVYLVTDLGGGADEPMAMLSGDFLFVGDAGRPDLLEQAAGLEGTQEKGARSLYRSLRKVSEMPCHVQVLPAHGAGSACGKALGSVPHSTFGYEEKFNPALKLALESGEEEFVKFILSGQPEPPAYFANMKRVNKVGPAVLGALPRPTQLDVHTVVARLEERGFVVLDTRDRAAFLAGHLRRSIFAPVEKFSDFAGSYLRPEQEVVLVVKDEAEVAGLVRQLVRMGFERIAGFIHARDLDAAPAPQLTGTRVVKFSEVPSLQSQNGGAGVLDVRKAVEYAGGHLRGALNIAHTRLLPKLSAVPMGQTLLVHCQSGLRATGACAFLEREGRQVVCVADKFENAPKELLA
ncbi:MAG TPA: MBL fold metallo-hydrolase [Candidatus Saccharimonadia bacterium]|nr:MBL fold metallo-hydrolase [Candidatus Saccharimonadia bacterium]